MASLPTCIICKEAIEADTEYTTADHGDVFHDRCFNCAGCGEPITNAFVCLLPDGSQRKFGHQKDGKYYHPDCGKKVGAGSERKTGNTGGKICVMCQKPLTAEEGGIEMVDGTALHFECFKCNKCGAVQDISDKVNMRLLRTKIGLLKKGEYECETCNPSPNKDAAPANQAFQDNLAKAKEEAARAKAEQDAKDAATAARIAGAEQAEVDKQAAFVASKEAAEAAKLAGEADKQAKFDSKPVWTLAELKDKKLIDEYHLNDLALLPGGAKEKLLSDEEFQSVLGMGKDAFAALPGWKQKDARKKQGIF